MRYLFFFILLLGFKNTFSQKLNGEIVDQLTGEPIGLVLISTEKSKITTDENGTFSIQIEGIKNITFSKTGYEELVIGVEDINIEDSKFVVELSSNTIDSDLESGIISLSDFDLSDDANSSDFASGQLSAYNDVFQSIAAYQFGIARFRQRGYDSRNNLVLMNGLELNKLYDGRPQWSNWGGLNDVLRNREYTKGLEVGNSSFGSINGSTNFILRTSEYQKGLRVSYSSTNTSYTNRVLATFSGTIKGDWHYTVSASRRWAEEGHFDGTFYDANSFFLSLEKIMNEFHSLNFVAIYAKNRRGKSSPNTQEVYDLTSENYNSYWGWQGGKKRNSRIKNLNEPIFILTHNWDLNDRSNLKTSLLYQFGSMGNSRLNYSGGPNPDPSYYRKLPSYYLRNYSDRADLSDYALSKFTSQSNYNQLDWNFMYQSNMLSNENNRSVYMLYEDRVDDELVQLNSVMNYDLNDNFDLSVGINAKNLVSNNFAYSLDMLGGDYYVDTDSYRSGDQAQNDLNNPDRVIGKNDKFKYNFIVRSLNLSAFSNITYSNNKFSFFLSPKYSYRSLQRDGQFRNGVYPENSFGKGEKKEFYSLSGKAGIEYRITGRHIININGAYIDRPPTIRNSFSNSRENHNFVDNLDTEKIYSLEGSYSMNVKPIKLNVTGYYTNFQNMTEISFFFAQGLSGLEESSDFVSEIMGGTHRDHYGLEFGAESNITSTIKLSSGVAFGEYGEGFVRIGLVENEQRIRQAAKNIRNLLK